MAHKEQLLRFLSDYADYRYTGPQDFFAPESAPWRGHVVFADMIVRACAPQTLVELGTYTGVSFFAFCNAVRRFCLNTQCVAVDTWKGEQHSGYYGEEVYAGVAAHLEENYVGFARLLRMTFDEAVNRFEDASIDILHIDGLHTYEAVRHDFETWLPKVRPGGVVLFHDVAEQHDDFGVFRFWDEIAPQADGHYCFRHSHGLGVWRKPGGPAPEHPLLQTLFAEEPAEADALAAMIRHFVDDIDAHMQREALLAEFRNLENAYRTLMDERNGLAAQCDALHQDGIALRQRIEDGQKAYDELLQSRSWKLTRPLRDIIAWFRG